MDDTDPLIPYRRTDGPNLHEDLRRAGDVDALLADAGVLARLDQLGAELAAQHGRTPAVTLSTTASAAATSATAPIALRHRPARATGRSHLPRPRRRRGAWVAGVLAAAVLLPATAAAAQWIGLHTGIFGSENGATSSEYLNINSPEGIALLRTFEAAYPLPAGGTYAAVEQRWKINPPGIAHADLFETAIYEESTCQWVGAWLEAPEDSPQKATAATVLGGRADLPLMNRISDSTGSARTLMTHLGDAAGSGDTTTVRDYQRANCTNSPGQG